MGGNTTADIEAKIGVEAARNKLALGRRDTDLQSQKFKEETALAQTKDVLAASRAGQTGTARSGLSDIEAGRGEATANLYGAGADLAQTFLGNQSLQGVMDIRNGTKSAAQAPIPQSAPTPQEVAAKGEALKKTSQTGVNMGTTPVVQKTTPATSGVNAANFNTSQSTKAPAPAAAPSAASQVGGFLQGALSKGKELMSQMPQAQQDQLKKTGMNAGKSIVKGLGIKI
jgi:hypothetical protein